MTSATRKTIAIAISVLLIGIAWYGSYLPLAKSYAHIDMLQSLNSIRTWQEFQQRVVVPLDMISPIGQEELARNFVGTIAMRVLQANGGNPAIVSSTLDMANDYLGSIVATGLGLSFCQNSYTMGGLYQIAFSVTHNPEYLLTAQKYYLGGLQKSPNRPQFLYGLYDTYRVLGDTQNAIATGNKILGFWPDDSRVRDSLNQLLASSTVPVVKKGQAGTTPSPAGQ